MARTPICRTCGGLCKWNGRRWAWVCRALHCRLDWPPRHGAEYAAPGEPLTFQFPDQFRRSDVVVDRDGVKWRRGTLYWLSEHATNSCAAPGKNKRVWSSLMKDHGPLQEVTT